ncbi:hypothetical protein DSECCO2_283220 [anaerobic digester metagenome]
MAQAVIQQSCYTVVPEGRITVNYLTVFAVCYGNMGGVGCIPYGISNIIIGESLSQIQVGFCQIYPVIQLLKHADGLPQEDYPGFPIGLHM